MAIMVCLGIGCGGAGLRAHSCWPRLVDCCISESLLGMAVTTGPGLPWGPRRTQQAMTLDFFVGHFGEGMGFAHNNSLPPRVLPLGIVPLSALHVIVMTQGTSRFLKENVEGIKCFAADPPGASMFSYYTTVRHTQQIHLQ